jgi:flagellar protein FlaJ
MKHIFRRIASLLPSLPGKLRQAGMSDTAEGFVKKTFISSFYVTTALSVIVWMTFVRMNISATFIAFLFIVLFFFIFGYFIRVPDVKISQQRRFIGRELVFAGRFMVVELESGVSLYDAMQNASRSFPIVGQHLKAVTDRVDFGTSMEEALNESIQNSPSPELAKIFWQILNVMKTGADVSRSINTVIDQIVREQMIEVKQYGKKLNPLAMFYMVIAVILPSLGVVALIVASSFMGITLTLPALLTIVGLLGFIQFMFVAIIKSSRPAVEI